MLDKLELINDILIELSFTKDYKDYYLIQSDVYIECYKDDTEDVFMFIGKFKKNNLLYGISKRFNIHEYNTEEYKNIIINIINNIIKELKG